MIQGKKIAIIGLGKEGAAAANFFAAENDVTIFDKKSQKDLDESSLTKTGRIIKYYQNSPADELKYDIVIRSPGVNPGNPLLQKIIKNGAAPKTPTQIFFDLCPCKIIGVTGTKGKGTTSTLIYELLKADNRDVYLAGNIGIPALKILPGLTSKSIAVLELSSFQLIDATKSPHIAVILMTTSEHLDWHKDQKEYLLAKKNITNFQTADDFAVVNYDFKNSKTLALDAKSKIFFFSTKTVSNGLYLKNGSIMSQIKGREEIAKISDVFIPGRHNLQNILAAITVAKIEKVPNAKILSVIKNFKGLKHRLQFVREVNGIKFYNDSYSTTPEAALAALEAFSTPKIIILGGSSKNSDFTKLSRAIIDDQNLKTVILIGDEAKRIHSEIKKAGKFPGKVVKGAKNMQDILKSALQNAARGDVVLLSPACASFDMFQNYEDRGEQFIKAVQKIT